MASKMIGFIGTDKYDILLYLSKVFCQLKQKILLVDYAENRALTCSIPVPRIDNKEQALLVKESDVQVERISFDDQPGKISYQGIDFLVEPMYGDLLELQEMYDIILIDFGFQIYSQLIEVCDQIYLCMDQQYHHIIPLKPFGYFNNGVQDKCYLLLQEVYDCKVNSGYIMEELGFHITEDRTFRYYQESADMKYCIDSQYNYTYHFMKLSKGLKSLIFYLLHNILPEITEHEIRYAYRSASTTKPCYERVRV